MRKAAVNASAAKLVPRKWPSARSLANPVIRDRKMPAATNVELRRDARSREVGPLASPPGAVSLVEPPDRRRHHGRRRARFVTESPVGARGLFDRLCGRAPQAGRDQLPGGTQVPTIPYAIGCGSRPPQCGGDIAYQPAASLL